MKVPLEFYEAVQADYPRWEGEDRVHWLERIAILAGGMKREDASEVQPDEDIKALKGKVRPKSAPALRKPYRDSDDEPERPETFVESTRREAWTPPPIAEEVVKMQQALNDHQNAALDVRDVGSKPRRPAQAPPIYRAPEPKKELTGKENPKPTPASKPPVEDEEEFF